MRRHFIPILGNMALVQLKPEHIQKYYSQKMINGCCNNSGGLSAQTIRHHHTALHKALQTAVEWGILSRNPADAVSLPHVQHPEMRTWGEAEITRFLETAENTPYYVLFYLALFTGMRRYELLALRWQDVDLIMNQVYVNRGLHILKGGKVIFRQPKTDKGRRAVALSPSTALLLKEYREKRELEQRMLGIPLKDGDLVFSHPDGKPLLPNTVTHAWIKLVRQSGLKSIRLHDARHSHASLMLKQGIHPKVVQERLGHSSIQITIDTYSHVSPGIQEAAAKRFDEAFSTKYNEPAKETVG
jgi:integrase